MITVSKPLAHVQVAGNVLVITSDSDTDITYSSSDDDFDGDPFSVYTKEEIENSVSYESDEVEEIIKNYDIINFKVERVKI